jgi:hypothetical protein
VILLEEGSRRAETATDGEAAVQLVTVVPQHVQARAGDAAENVVLVVAHRAVELDDAVEEGAVGLQEDARRAVLVVVDAVVDGRRAGRVVVGAADAAQVFVAVGGADGDQGGAERLLGAGFQVVLGLVGLVVGTLVEGILLVPA